MLRRGRPSDEDILLSLIPENGEAAGNASLQKQLAQRGWSGEKYWSVRDDLLDQGILVRGKGKGGSVRRTLVDEGEVVALPPSEEPAAQIGKGQRALSELSLYEPLVRVLANEWAREMRIESHQIHFEVSALQGRKPTGGTWTRPDISAVSVRTFEHLPSKYLDVWTFEVKTANWLDVTAIFETAAHGSRATRSYALLQVPEILSAREEEILGRCEREAVRLRVGLISFIDPSRFETWETRVEAPRVDTAPEDLEALIAQLSHEAKSKLARWK
jgi:hypothetical protein